MQFGLSLGIVSRTQFPPTFFSFTTSSLEEEFIWKSESELDEWITGRTVSAEGGFSIGWIILPEDHTCIDEEEIEIPPTIQQILESKYER